MTNSQSPSTTSTSMTASIKQLGLLLALVLFVKFFIADIFVIPSGSMEPTLHGRENSGDRIFCTRVDYYFRAPHRWEVIVFKFPYEEAVRYTRSPEAVAANQGQNFIKRCIGLPNETLTLLNGDVFVDVNGVPTRQVKPDELQRHLWIGVYREDFADLKPTEFAHYWKWDKTPLTALQISPQVLQIKTTAPVQFTYRPQTRLGLLAGVPDRYVRRQFVEYTCPQCKNHTRQSAFIPQFTARCAHCQRYLTEKDVTYYDYRSGYPSNEHGDVATAARIRDNAVRGDYWHWVADLRLRAQVQFAAMGEFSFVLTSNDTRAELRLAVAADGGNATFWLNGKNYALPATATTKIDFPLHTWHEVEFYLCDGEYRAFIDGKPIFAVAPQAQTLHGDLLSITQSGAAFVVNGAVNLTALTLDRDIFYYGDTRGARFTLPPDNYFAAGDNCPSSNDSRMWGPVPAKNLIGPAWAVWWPLDALRAIK